MNLGIDPILAWDYTPVELELIGEAKASEQKSRLNELIYLAWHTEAFARQKRLPSLEKLLKDDKPQMVSKSDLILKQMAKEKGVIIK